jgi:hypothetical protein
MYEPFAFSLKLQDRLITYFKQNYSLEVIPEEAQMFLRSIARLYDALTKQGPLSPSA